MPTATCSYTSQITGRAKDVYGYVALQHMSNPFLQQMTLIKHVVWNQPFTAKGATNMTLGRLFDWNQHSSLETDYS